MGQSGVRNAYEVFVVSERDPEVLTKVAEVLAVNGHGAIWQTIEAENEESPLAANDFVAFPKWAAQRCHYNGSGSSWEGSPMGGVEVGYDEP